MSLAATRLLRMSVLVLVAAGLATAVLAPRLRKPPTSEIIRALAAANWPTPTAIKRGTVMDIMGAKFYPVRLTLVIDTPSSIGSKQLQMGELTGVAYFHQDEFGHWLFSWNERPH